METQLEDMTIEEFCNLHGACLGGRNWALTHCQSMQEFWRNTTILDSSWLVWVATRYGVLTDKELRLFAARCVAEISELLVRPASFAAIAAAEQYAHGAIDDAALAKSYWAAAVAGSEVDSETDSAIRSASLEDAKVVSRLIRMSAAKGSAARAAQRLVAGSVFREDAYAIYCDVRLSIIDDAISHGNVPARRMDQFHAVLCEYLRENCTPDFTRKEDRNGDENADQRPNDRGVL